MFGHFITLFQERGFVVRGEGLRMEIKTTVRVLKLQVPNVTVIKANRSLPLDIIIDKIRIVSRNY